MANMLATAEPNLVILLYKMPAKALEVVICICNTSNLWIIMAWRNTTATVTLPDVKAQHTHIENPSMFCM
jgi:hypothetical protein